MAEHVEAAGVSARQSGAGAAQQGVGAMQRAGADNESAPFVSQVPGTPVSFPSYHGRPVSWVAVSLIMAAFLAGGLALVFGPTWWLFWTAIGVAAVGTLLGLSTGIFDDWY